MKTYNILLIGAGNIGSRHLQGIKKINLPLNIEVVDPSLESLQIAEERYSQIPSRTNHQISFSQTLNGNNKEIDLAIIATSSSVRRKVLEDLLKIRQVKYLILEKILFQKRQDYAFVEKLLQKKDIKTWVNFSMRTMPFYANLRDKLNSPIQMIVSGSQYGLITNAIHFTDYISYLTGSEDFKVSTTSLEKKIIQSKRKGYLELNGTLNVNFKDGSSGVFICYTDSDAPFTIELLSNNFRAISKESERKAYVSNSSKKWLWKEITTDIPFQSDMTSSLVTNILKKGVCNLTPFSQAAQIHLQLLEELLKFLNQNSKTKYKTYPFT